VRQQRKANESGVAAAQMACASLSAATSAWRKIGNGWPEKAAHRAEKRRAGRKAKVAEMAQRKTSMKSENGSEMKNGGIG